ncbi:hypothetical protein [Streptomyces sp. NPDC001315]|uniref:hypothetical protein n=1 Tax=Streptomyces sp. NPDC001315 TaxID=3364562 RepID=UPI0036AE8108
MAVELLEGFGKGPTEIEATPGRVQVLARIDPLRSVMASYPTAVGPVVLRIEVAATQEITDARQPRSRPLSTGPESPNVTTILGKGSGPSRVARMFLAVSGCPRR